MKGFAISLLLILASMQCEAEDVIDQRFATAKNPFVLDLRGNVEVPPSFIRMAADAATQNGQGVVITALLSGRNSRGLVVSYGEFEQTCTVFPAKRFVDFVSAKAKAEGTEIPDMVYMYRFMSEEKRFTPESMALCSPNETDRTKWSLILSSPPSFRAATTPEGRAFAYAIKSTGVYFFY